MHVDQVRSFNRTVTERIGALQDSYLASDRPLGADRVLWEIGDGTDLRALRNRLGLDSGYLSRLIGVAAARGPGRDRARRRTSASARSRSPPPAAPERALLDRCSDELARSLLAPLSAAQRERLVDAMATVERLLTAGLVEIAVEDPASADARYCLGEYYDELDARFDGGFEVGRTLPTDDAVFLVARLRGEPVGCGAIKVADELRSSACGSPRTARGLGLGRRMLSELERLLARPGSRAWRPTAT